MLEYIATGDIAFLARLRERYPEGLLRSCGSRHGTQEDPHSSTNMAGVVDVRDLERPAGRDASAGCRAWARRPRRSILRAIESWTAAGRTRRRRAGRPPAAAEVEPQADPPRRGACASLPEVAAADYRRQPAPLPVHRARHRPGGGSPSPTRSWTPSPRCPSWPGWRPAGRHQTGGRHPHRPERRPARRAARVLRQPAATLHRQRRPQRRAARVRAAPRLQDQRVPRRSTRVRTATITLRHRSRGLRHRGSALHPARVARGPGRDRGGRSRERSRTWSSCPICAATCTSTPTGPTAGPPWSRWPSPPGRGAWSTSASATTPSRWP